jgi:hypothetical protein
MLLSITAPRVHAKVKNHIVVYFIVLAEASAVRLRNWKESSRFVRIDWQSGGQAHRAHPATRRFDSVSSHNKIVL